MNRREWIAGAAALTVVAASGAEAAPARRFSVEVRGKGRDVLLLPGLTAPRSVWNGTVAAVPGYRYHLVQVAGFAGEPAGANASGPVLAPLVSDLAAYIASKGLTKPAVIGHSMGGTLAMMLADRYPARVGKAMVVDMLPAPAGLFGINPTGAAPLFEGIRAFLTSSASGRRMLESMMASYGGGRAADSDPDVVAQVTHELANTDLTPRLGGIKVPLTVVYATPRAREGFDPAEVSRSYRSAYAGASGAKLVRIGDSGHMIMADQPARFQAAMKAFLAG